MQLLHKFSTYLLENYPISWHTKWIQLLCCGILIWLIAFISAYIYIDYDVLQGSSFYEYYFSSNFIFFHIVYLLIVVVVWGILFYRNNPIKHIYPLQKQYFFRVFLQLLVAFFFLISAYIPFNYGVQLKVNSILPEQEVIQNQNIINRAYPFLVDNSEAYSIIRRAYPKPFPLEEVSYDKNTKSWNYIRDKTMYIPNLQKQKYIPYDEINQFNPQYFEGNATIIEGNKYLFYATENRYESSDSCTSYLYVNDIPKLSEYDLQENSIYNFSSILVDFTGNNYSLGYYTNDIDDEYVQDSEFYAKQYAKDVHSILDKKDKNQITQRIEAFKNVLSQYRVEHRINTKDVVNYIYDKDFGDFKTSVVANTEFKNLGNDGNYAGEVMKTKAVDEVEYAVDTDNDSPFVANESLRNEYLNRNLIYLNENHSSYYYTNFYAQSELRQLYQNYYSSTKYESYDYIIGFLIASIFLAWFFIWFEYTKVVDLLISIPIAGVITTLTAFILIAINYKRYTSENTNFSFILFVLFLIVSLTILSVFSKKTSKKISNILMNLTHAIAPFLIPLSLGLLSVLTEYDVPDKCYRTLTVRPMDFLMNPEVFILTGVFGIFLFMQLIPIWRAKKENN
ncbi:MAG: hypothetical protein H6604_04180 [Flavobacteriales bacterium]|nr:hypothetical protein [Flavobacteriales bacterium]